MKYIVSSLILISLFLYGDFSILLKGCLVYGFLIYTQSKNFNEKYKKLAILFILTMPSIGLLITNIKFKDPITIKPFLLWTTIVLIGALIKMLFERIKLKQANKTALLMSLIMLMVVPIFRKFGEGNYSVLASLSYLSAGFYIFRMQPLKPYIPFTLLFTPYLVVHIADAMLSDSIPGFLLVIPSLILSIIILITFVQFAKKDSKVKTILSIITIFVIFPTIWLAQENYSNWISSRANPKRDKNHFQITRASDNKLVESSSKQINVFLFTSAYCGNCKKEYPHFSELAEKYSSNDNIGFYGTFLTFKEVDSIYYKTIIKKKFVFQWALAHQSTQLYNDLGISGVPSLLIVDNNDNVLYNGYCRIRPWLFVNSPEMIIDRYIKNN